MNINSFKKINVKPFIVKSAAKIIKLIIGVIIAHVIVCVKPVTIKATIGSAYADTLQVFRNVKIGSNYLLPTIRSNSLSVLPDVCFGWWIVSNRSP